MSSLVGAITTLGLLGSPTAAPVFDPDYGLTEFPRPYTETWTALSVTGLSGKRAVDFSGKTEVTTSELSVSDTASLSATESPVDSNEIATSDTARISTTETAALFNNIAVSDTVSVAASDSVSLSISGVTLKTGTDTASASTTETAVLNVSLSVTDTASVSATDISSVAVSTEQKTGTDTASISADESVLLTIFAGVNEINVSDDAVLTVNDAATAVEVRRIKRISLSITQPRIEIEIL